VTPPYQLTLLLGALATLTFIVAFAGTPAGDGNTPARCRSEREYPLSGTSIVSAKAVGTFVATPSTE
jgi:hypothetical protein